MILHRLNLTDALARPLVVFSPSKLVAEDAAIKELVAGMEARPDIDGLRKDEDTKGLRLLAFRADTDTGRHGVAKFGRIAK